MEEIYNTLDALDKDLLKLENDISSKSDLTNINKNSLIISGNGFSKKPMSRFRFPAKFWAE